MSYTPLHTRKSRPKKYGPGEPFHDIHALLDLAIEAMYHKRDVFVWLQMGEKGKPLHVFVATNMSAFAVRRRVENGTLRRAIVTDEYRAWLAREAMEVGSLA